MRLRPLSTVFLTLLLLAVAAGILFIATFDLNSHRERLQTMLSSSLSRPVTLGEARLSLRHGLALSFARLDIPPAPSATWDLQAERIFVRLQILPLFTGRLQFSQILIDAPHLQMALTGSGTASVLPDLRRWTAAGVRSITLNHGRLIVEDRRDPARPYRLEVEEADIRLLHLAAGRPAKVSVSGRLRQAGESARFELAGGLVPAVDRQDADLRLTLKVEGFDPSPLLFRYAQAPVAATGTFSLHLAVNGSAAAGFQLDGKIAGQGLAFTLPGYQVPVAVTQAGLRGTLQPMRSGGRFRGAELSLDGVAVKGDLAWERRNGEMQMEANLASLPLPAAAVLRLVPDRWSLPLRQKTTGGMVELQSLHFAGAASSLVSPGPGFPLQAQLKVDRLTLLRPNGNHVTLAFHASLADDLLQVREGKATLLGTPFHFSGALEQPFGPYPELTAELEGTPEMNSLRSEFPPSWRDRFAAAGPVPFALWVTGKDERLLLDIRADLTQVAAVWGEASKPAGHPGSLMLTGKLTRHSLELSHARLHLPPLDLRARGSRALGEQGAFFLALDAVGFDLKAAGTSLPQLAKFQTNGQIDLHLELGGEGERLLHRTGQIRLHGVDLHLGKIVADLHQAEGTLRIEPEQVRIERLTAFLGSSPIAVEGTIRNLAEPQAEVRVKARSVRAYEVIFPSEKAYLRDLDANLLLSRSEISFQPARVRLDGGTEAVVTGSVRLSPQPQVDLDIDAARGNIDEVIALWERTEAPPRVSSTGHDSELSVRITAHAAQGEIGGLLFQQATGLITWNHGVLAIHPLTFRVGAGSGTGMVIFDGHRSPSLLQVSGHLEEIDAAAVHGQVLKNRGLITGTLQGDFYLEGEVGKTFLKTSRGGFSLEVRHGVLRKFKSLAKVFSVLNVSQIFALRLPDMAREGMPFDRLTATFSLSEGVLATEDLLVDSNAMNLSLVGNADLKSNRLDFVLGVKPLRTVDKIVTSIPLAGWVLAGEEKALITAHFTIRGTSDDPEVMPVPITSVSQKVLGIFRRVFNLPGKMINDVGEMVDHF